VAIACHNGERMNISALFIQRPIGTSLLAAGLFLLGLSAWRLLPVAPLPQVDFPTIQVSAALPGASPETMASNVATPLERYFSLIPGLAQMTSTSTLGSTSITLQFDLNRSVDSAAIDVAAAINAAGGQLPSNLPSPPTYRKVNPADRPVLIMGLSSDTLPLTQVSDLADSIVAQQISQLPGVGQVSIFGQQKPAVRVQIEPAKISTLGLGLEDVRAQIAASTVNAPKGAFDGPTQSVTVYANDQILSATAWNDVIVGYRNGAPIRVRDIGQAVDGPENAKSAAWTFAGATAGAQAGELANGKSILLAVFKEPGANVIETVDGITRALPKIETAIPPAVKLGIVSDRTQTIRASVADVEFTLLLTVALVVLIIFLFLRNVPATLIPAATIPLAILGTAAFMYLAGYSLDNLSLMALTIAVGFVVDDAVVVLENIYRHLESGLSPREAALKGSQEVGFTVISISVSLVAVFIPLLFMGGIIGRFFREFAATVTFAIALSVAVCLTLIPMLASRFLKEGRGEERHGVVFRWFEAMFDWMQRSYERALRVVLRHQPLTLLVFAATVATTVALYVAIPKGFFPQQDTGFIQGIAEASQDSSFAAMSQRALAVADVVRSDPDVYSVALSLGSGTYNNSNFFITLKSRDAGRKASADQIIARLRPKVAQLEGVNLYMQATQDVNVGGRLARTQYQYTLTDANIAELSEWAPRILERLRALPQLADVVSDQQTGAAALNLTIDRDRASSYGISPAAIDATLYDAIGQRQIAQYFTQLNAYHVVLEVTPELQKNPGLLLDKLFIASPVAGKQVPLSTFAKVDNTRTNYLSVSHQGQFPAITISFNLAPGAALGDAVDAIRSTPVSMGAPGSLSGAFQGTAQAFQQSLASQPYLIAAALVAVYIVLGLLYESYIHPLTILSTLPSAGVGALLILILFGYELTVIALIAIILLIGIVKKNGIMLVDFALTAERERGLAPEASIFEACRLRFRPIMMTTMCALLAGVPLMLGTGTGSELRRPLGFAIVGGLALSQLLTLFTTSVIYLYLDRASRWYERAGGTKRASQEA
jgi:hydrophobic/amphiphilic exporter-1 (mainly G- bacteria), HAE1 family